MGGVIIEPLFLGVCFEVFGETVWQKTNISDPNDLGKIVGINASRTPDRYCD
jgi:hypothetical protein